jgi:glucose-6-phosphate 1-dehydrogenase
MATSDFDLVLFGGTGDLSMRKLLPALYARDRARDLPPDAHHLPGPRREIARRLPQAGGEGFQTPRAAANLDAASGTASPIACNMPRSTPRKPTASAT